MIDADYVRLLKNLFPKGRVWNKEPGSVFHLNFLAMAQEFARFDLRLSNDLVNEADPRTTLELLSDWERVVGLPDSCRASTTSSVDVRRNEILRKLSTRGGQHKQFFIALAAAFGYTVTIDEPRVLRAGFRASDRCYSQAWIHHFRVIANSAVTKNFRAGSGRSGDRIRTWTNTTLECVINQVKPAQTIVHFVYGS